MDFVALGMVFFNSKKSVKPVSTVRYRRHAMPFIPKSTIKFSSRLFKIPYHVIYHWKEHENSDMRVWTVGCYIHEKRSKKHFLRAQKSLRTDQNPRNIGHTTFRIHGVLFKSKANSTKPERFWYRLRNNQSKIRAEIFFYHFWFFSWLTVKLYYSEKKISDEFTLIAIILASKKYAFLNIIKFVTSIMLKIMHMCAYSYHALIFTRNTLIN